MRKKLSIKSRDPVEFDSLLRRWQTDADKVGYPATKTDLKRTLAVKLNHMTFRPDMGVFKERDFIDDLFAPKRRRRK